MNNTTNNMAGDYDRSNFYTNEGTHESLERSYTGFDIFSCPTADDAGGHSWSEFVDHR